MAKQGKCPVPVLQGGDWRIHAPQNITVHNYTTGETVQAYMGGEKITDKYDPRCISGVDFDREKREAELIAKQPWLYNLIR